jgi:hypothetical protein
MIISTPLLISPTLTKGLTAAIAIILLASNFTVINAQEEEQQQQLTSPLGEIVNATTTSVTAETRTFQSTKDSLRLQVPQGWVIQDVNNSGFTLGVEVLEGFGILAQLCPEEEPQQQGATSATLSTNASDNMNNNNSNTSTTDNSCQGAQQEVIHIIRYPGLETRIQQEANNVTIYHLQKLQEVGYSRIQIVNSTATTVNITDPQTNQSIATVPAKIVEMIYSTSSDPNETRLGYFILTSTRATLPNLGTIKGYAVFYEGNTTTTTTTTTTTNSNTTATATPEITTTSAAAASSSSDSSAMPTPTPLPPAVEQVFDSFELIAAPEVAQAIAQQAAAEEAAALGEGGDEDNGDDDDTGGADDGGDGGGDDDDGADEEEGDGEGEGDDDDTGGADDDDGADEEEGDGEGEGDDDDTGGGGEEGGGGGEEGEET